MKIIKEFFNGYINFFTFLVIVVGVVTSGLSKNSALFASWVVVLVFFLRTVSLETTRDLQHEIIKNQELQINILNVEIENLKEGK